MDAINELKNFKSKFDLELEKYLEKKTAEYNEISDFAKDFTKILAEFTLRGGKRFRPALLYYTYRLFNGNSEEEIIRLSIFTELLQSFLLIHDDIMDRAKLRRGEKTVHKIFENFSKQNGFKDDKHFGETMAILSGDLANQIAYEVIADSKFEDRKKIELLKLVSLEISKVCFGQVHDILLNYNYPKKYTHNDVLKVHHYKTATYTYRLPMFAGALLAGADNKDIELIDEYAIPSGIAFQIRDDVLGVFGEEGKLGKDVMGDIKEGKKTLLVTKAYELGTDQDRSIMDKLIGKKDLSLMEAEEIQNIFKRTGALDFSIEYCEENIKKAKKALLKLENVNEEARQFLIGIADYVILRNI